MILVWCLFLLAAATPLAAEPAEVPAETVTVSPVMKPVDRDWEYFSVLKCQQLEAQVAHSPLEQRLLERRQRQCIEQYKAFFSRPVER